jgi:hypothetical protein
MRTSILFFFALFAAFGSHATSAFAAPIQASQPTAYTDRMTWLAAAGGSTTLVDFESVPAGVPITTQLASYGIANVSGMSVFESPPGATTQFVSSSTSLPFPMFTAGTLPSETHFLSNRMTPGVYACGEVTFQFGTPTRAIGMYAAGLMTTAHFVIDISDGATSLGSISLPSAQLPNSFFGLVSAQPFTIATCHSDSTVDSWGLDDLEFDGGPTGVFCSGDGSGTACPCGNAGASGNGCASSVSSAGAHLAGSGIPSIASDTFTLIGTLMPNSSALYFQGTSQTGGGGGLVFGDGLRCAGGTIVRLGAKTNVSGGSSYPTGGDAPISIKGANVAGGLRDYQVWYRNAAPFCSPSTFNLTNGVEITWLP